MARKAETRMSALMSRARHLAGVAIVSSASYSLALCTSSTMCAVAVCGWNFGRLNSLSQGPRKSQQSTYEYSVCPCTSCTYLSRLPLQSAPLILCQSKIVLSLHQRLDEELLMQTPPPFSNTCIRKPHATSHCRAFENKPLPCCARFLHLACDQHQRIGQGAYHIDVPSFQKIFFFLRCTRAERANDDAKCGARLAIQTHTSACVATKAIRKCRPRNGALLQVHGHP
ncbi:hypothetical protein J3F84DRAFT_155780 [Trichoderma pleuroticola]